MYGGQGLGDDNGEDGERDGVSGGSFGGGGGGNGGVTTFPVGVVSFKEEVIDDGS